MLTALYPGRHAAVTPAGDLAPGGRDAYLHVLLLAALSYQLWLAFAHTHFGLGGRATVVAAEMLILAACLPLLLRRLPLALCLGAALVLANGVALALAREAFDAKPLRDLLVPLVFLWVGMNSPGAASADRILRHVIWVVLAFALFEFLFVELYTRLFDIYSYYVARGAADPEMGLYRTDRLVASGMRPEGIGRVILPFLGPHRVSSVFIEPVSFGNFAVICAAWGLAKARDEWRATLFFVGAAALMLVLNDSRFGLVSVALLLVLRLVLVRGAEPLGMVFPFICMVALIAVALATGGQYSDTFVGRLTLTGITLMRLDLPQIFGLVTPPYGYFDMGYPYVLANFGVVACLALWATFWLLPLAGDAARRFRVYVALYLALILCVSGTSVFAFKTSALLWFLLGSFAAGREA
jgi:putative polymerase